MNDDLAAEMHTISKTYERAVAAGDTALAVDALYAWGTAIVDMLGAPSIHEDRRMRVVGDLGDRMNGEGAMDEATITVLLGQEPQPVYCLECGIKVDGFRHQLGYAVTPYRGSNEVFVGQMDDIPDRAKFGVDRQIESAPDFDKLTLRPCGHVVPAWARARMYRELLTASAQVAANARAERQQKAADRIHAALTEAAVDGTDLRQVAEIAAREAVR